MFSMPKKKGRKKKNTNEVSSAFFSFLFASMQAF